MNDQVPNLLRSYYGTPQVKRYTLKNFQTCAVGGLACEGQNRFGLSCVIIAIYKVMCLGTGPIVLTENGSGSWMK